MDQFRERYYKLSKIHLIVVGLWPYNTSAITKVQIIICFLFIVCGLVFQLIPFIDIRYTPMHIIKCSSHIGAVFSCLFKYSAFLYQIGSIRQYLEIVKYDWNDVRNETELAILKEYTRIGRLYVMISACKEEYQQKSMRCIKFRPITEKKETVKVVIYFAAFMYALTLVILISPFFADVLDWIIPLNESRRRELPVRLEMFIDQETHYYLPAFIFDTIFLICGLLTIATDGIMTMWLLHCCGLFAIARFVNHIKSRFLATYFILLIIGVVVQVVDLYLMSEAMLLHNIDHIFLYGMCVLGEYGYIFYLNYIVELVMDSHKSIFVELCNTEWYEAPLRIQKIILFMMLRCSTPISFNMFNMFSISLEGFALIMRRTMSYFAVISSVSLEN